ncbi:MAG: serine/threonine protein kinase [Myxococcales bacterium]|nr:serine/threonine protein kinase [Myxococcales bacterium]
MSLEGRSLGRYSDLRILGEGGMGRVFLATDGVLGRKVAIKVLRDDLGLGAEARAHLDARLRIEARAAALVTHPNVVVLHDMGDDPEVGLYLVFEHVDGPSLRARLEKGPLTLPDVVRLAKELGSALDAAHDAGVLHRDVKPENVFLAPFGAKIGDFGIARVPDASVTRTGMGVVGTPAYAAPEVLRGKDPSPSPKADQFSLAATVYEALTGERAFPGDDLISVAAQIGQSTPAEVTRHDLPREAANQATAVLRRGMAKDPAARFGSCTELADALEAALGSSAIAPTVPSARREARPGRSLSVLLGLVIVMGLAAIVLTRATGQKTPGPPASDEPPTKPLPKPKPHAVKPPPKPQEPKGADATPPPQAPASEPDGGPESP